MTTVITKIASFYVIYKMILILFTVSCVKWWHLNYLMASWFSIAEVNVILTSCNQQSLTICN